MAAFGANTDKDSILDNLEVVACDISESFVEAYYNALTADRNSLTEFYAPSYTNEHSLSFPTIVWNGHNYTSATEFQSYVQGLTYLHGTIETLDCHVLNPQWLPAASLRGGTGGEDSDLERRMAIMVYVSGSIRLAAKNKGPLRLFSENFMLVPNPNFDPVGSRRNGAFKAKDQDGTWKPPFLIHNQNFSFTEWGDGELKMTAEGKPVKEDILGIPTKGFGQNRNYHNAFAAAGLLNKGKAT